MACLNSEGRLYIFDKVGLHNVEPTAPNHSIPTSFVYLSLSGYITLIDEEGGVWKLDYGPNNVFEPIQKGKLPPMTKVAAYSHQHTLFLDESGNVWGYGSNENGNIGKKGTYSRPKQIKSLANIVAIACGEDHSVAVSSEGIAFGVGRNGLGQLGQGDIIARKKWTIFPNLENIIDVQCGSFHTMFLTISGHVIGTGNNGEGQLGLGDNAMRTTPVQNNHLPPIRMIVCRFYSTLCVDAESKLWGFGSNSVYELGLGDTRRRVIPELIPEFSKGTVYMISEGGLSTVLKDTEGDIWSWGTPEKTPKKRTISSDCIGFSMNYQTGKSKSARK